MADNVYESDNVRDNEQRKFRANGDGDTCVTVCDVDALAELQAIATNTGGTAGAIQTDHFNGSVGVANTQVPAVAGDGILEVLVHNTASSNNLFVSFDGGVNYITLSPDANIIWCLSKNATQIDIKGSAAATNYEIVMNRQA